MIASLPPPHTVLDLLPDAVCIVDEDGRFLFVNAAFERILGFPSDEVLGRRAFEFVHPDDLSSTLQQADQVMAGQVQRHFRNRYIHKDGHPVDMQWSARWSPEHGVRIAVAHEVTELRHAERAMEHLAKHDHLTGLPNRHHLQQELMRATDYATTNGTELAVLYIDLDGFKAVNDESGHEVGDGLLREVATRLRSVIRSGDTAARVGGDEFVIIMPGCPADTARQFAEFVRSQLIPSYELPTGVVHLDASVGMAIFPDHGCDPATLLAHADRDMYAVKGRRKK
jgi:diguanylate cyclase (GGDEF)-like protein/PAS domain S-box-containing protein